MRRRRPAHSGLHRGEEHHVNVLFLEQGGACRSTVHPNLGQIKLVAGIGQMGVRDLAYCSLRGQFIQPVNGKTTLRSAATPELSKFGLQ